jgi:hypothetical protein
MLDWNAGLDLGAILPECTVFSPPDVSGPLPYLDRSVDIVVCPRGTSAAADARRVANALVIQVSRRRRAGGSSAGAPGISLSFDWQTGTPAKPARGRVSLVKAPAVSSRLDRGHL